MKFFFDAELPDYGFHGGLNAASVQRRINQMRIFQAPFPVGKKVIGMPVDRPEIPQDEQSLLRHGNQPVFVALGVSDVGPHAASVDISGLQPDPFAKA